MVLDGVEQPGAGEPGTLTLQAAPGGVPGQPLDFLVKDNHLTSIQVEFYLELY